MREVTKEDVLKALSNVAEPDLKGDIVSLNLVSDIEIEDSKVAFTVKVKNPAMHARKRMIEACEFALQRAVDKDLKVDCTIIAQDKGSEKSVILQEKKQHLFQASCQMSKTLLQLLQGKGGVGKVYCYLKSSGWIGEKRIQGWFNRC